MILHEGGDEEIAVIIARLQAQGGLRAAGHHGMGQRFGAEVVKELVLGAGVAEQRDIQTHLAHHQAGIVARPSAFVRSQISSQLFAPPVRARRVADRREGRDRTEAPRQAHGEGECAVTTHGMARDRLPFRVEGEFVEEQARQILGHIIPHAEMRGPWRLRRVDVEARPLPQIIGRVIGHAFAARAGVGKDQGDPLLCRPALRAGLDHRVFMRAGQARQIPQDGDGAVLRLGRKEQAEGHVGARGLGGVFIDALHTAETGILRDGLHG